MKKEYLPQNRLLLLIISFIFVQSCASLKREARPQPENILTRTEDVLRLHAQDQSKKNRLVADGKIKIETESATHSFDFDLAAQFPISTRLEFSHTLGGTLAILVTNPQEYLFYEINEKLVHKGRDRISVLPSLFPYPLTTAELAQVLLNQFPMPSVKKNLDFTYNAHENAYEISFLAQSKKWRFLFDPTQFYLLGVSIRKLDESLHLSVEYYHFTKIKEELYFPKVLKIDSPLTHATLLLKYENLNFEKPLHADFFKLDIPEHVEIIRN